MTAQTSRSVLVRHDLPDATFHFDWFVQNPADPSGPLRSFRLAPSLDARSVLGGWSGPARFEAERTPDHRNVYLDYEGEVSNHRGHVKLVGSWLVRVAEWTESTLCLDILPTIVPAVVPAVLSMPPVPGSTDVPAELPPEPDSLAPSIRVRGTRLAPVPCPVADREIQRPARPDRWEFRVELPRP